MRRLVLLLFSSWLIIAGSCSIKDLALHGMDRTDVEASTLPVNKATAVLSTEAALFSQACAQNLVEITSAILITPIQQLAAISDFTFQAVLLLISLVFLYQHNSLYQSTPVLSRNGSRLYLQLKRIQIYA